MEHTLQGRPGLASFRNWWLASLIFLGLPAALLAAYAGGGVLSLGSLVGIITVLGIAAQRYLRGAGERLSPTLMTTLCTGLALPVMRSSTRWRWSF